MKTIDHKKADWFNKVELAGYVFQLVIACLAMLILAVMASKVGDIWRVLF